MRFLRTLCLFSLSLVLTAGCGSVSSRRADGDAGVDAALPTDARADAATDAPLDAALDAPIDAPPPLPPPGSAPALTVVGGAVSDSRFRFEVEITGGVTGGSVASATHTFTPASAVTTPQGAN